MIKINLFFIALLFGVVSMAQFNDGTYKTAHPDFTKIELLNRKNGTIKATFSRLGAEPFNLVFHAVDDKKTSYETQKKAPNKSFYHIENQDGNLALYEIDEQRIIKSEAGMGQNGKQLKSSTKHYGFKSAMQMQLETVKGTTNPAPIKYLVLNPTSQFHKDHVGEMVFFKDKPVIGQEDLSKMSNSFQVGEAIWAVVYLPTALKNFESLTHFYQDAYGKITHDLYVGIDKLDEDLEESEMPIVNSASVKALSEADLEKNYIIFQILPALEGQNEMHKTGGQFITERFGERVEAYQHELEIALTDANKASRYSRAEMAEIETFKGVITFDASKGTEVYKTLGEKLANEALEKKQLPTALYRDEALEREMIAQMTLYFRNKGWDDVKIYGAIITLDWQVLTDDYGQIIGKYVEGDITYSSDEGCAYMNVGFLKKYQGGGQYASAIQQYTTGPRGQVSCNKLKP